jgi:hypothetical protein
MSSPQGHRLTLFIGADLPSQVTGLPARADLARDMARRHELDESLSLAEVAQRVSRAGHRFEFTDFLRNALDTSGQLPRPFHRRVAELVETHGIQTIITTAYDDLLELTLKQAGLGFNRVVSGDDVPFISPDRPTLIKLYGDIQQPETLIVTDHDHLDMLRDRDREGIVEEVRHAFRQDTVLFLGYNLADPDFRFIFDQVAESRFSRTAYAVWPGLPDADVNMWRDRGIIILASDPWAVLSEDAAPPVAPSPPGEPSVPITVSAKDLSLVRQLNVLLSPAHITPPVHTLRQDLPFNELSWEQFEALCAALVEAQPATIDCHLFGVQGDIQQGIDIVSTQQGADGEETWVYQCKRYKRYGADKLEEALSKMAYQADFFVLMLSIPATANLRQVAVKHADAFLWDSKDIARKLKMYPVIVEDFFGPVWRQAFCG